MSPVSYGPVGAPSPSRFTNLDLVGSGAFGVIYKADDKKRQNCKVAIKLEKDNLRRSQLGKEDRMYRTLMKKTGSVPEGFAEAIHFGLFQSRPFLAMTLLGPNLEVLFQFCKQFSLKTVLMIGLQLMQRLETFHEFTGHIHRDIKPENLLIGNSLTSPVIYLTDLGLAKPFIDPRTNRHVEQNESSRKKSNLTGTARFASINSHLGMGGGRRDDLEGAAYVLIYFALGRLPWQGIVNPDKAERYQKICEMKKSIPSQTLCRDLPKAFQLLLEYAKLIRFQDCPDYALLQRMFREKLQEEGFENDGKFDWHLLQDCC